MFDTLPKDTFFFYIVLFWVQFVAVMAYGLWWYFQPDKSDKK